MPDYKRKKFKKSPMRHRNTDAFKDEIQHKVKQKSNNVYESPVRVVSGKKRERKKRTAIFVLAAVCVAAVLSLISYLLPVGLFENISNTFSLFGEGSYPIELSGSETLDCVSKDSYYYVLTDTTLAAYSKNGKVIYSVSHGFSSPVLATSETRALIFDQNGNTAYIYNLKGLVETVVTENSIITAAISRNGAYTLVTSSEEYTATVNVYNKNSKQVYKWNSAKEIINNVVISPSGKSIAVSSLTASGGQYVSKVMVLGFNSADPLYTLEIGNDVVLSLKGGSRGFAALTRVGYTFISWSKFQKKEISASGVLDMYRSGNGISLLVFNRVSDKSDNTVILASSKGEQISEFTYKGTINDIQYRKGRIYCVSDTEIRIFDRDGNLLKEGDCGYGCVKAAVISTDVLAIITDNEITEVKVEKEND